MVAERRVSGCLKEEPQVRSQLGRPHQATQINRRRPLFVDGRAENDLGSLSDSFIAQPLRAFF